MEIIKSPDGTVWRRTSETNAHGAGSGYIGTDVWESDTRKQIAIYSRRDSVDFHPGMAYKTDTPDGSFDHGDRSGAKHAAYATMTEYTGRPSAVEYAARLPLELSEGENWSRLNSIDIGDTSLPVFRQQNGSTYTYAVGFAHDKGTEWVMITASNKDKLKDMLFDGTVAHTINGRDVTVGIYKNGAWIVRSPNKFERHRGHTQTGSWP